MIDQLTASSIKHGAPIINLLIDRLHQYTIVYSQYMVSLRTTKHQPSLYWFLLNSLKYFQLKALEIHLSEEKGDILVFLTSPAEVDIGVVDFERMANNTNKSYKVLPLHGKLQSEDQMKVFEVLADARKIVFATNVAETSVTIPGRFQIMSACDIHTFFNNRGQHLVLILGLLLTTLYY